jgi:hypothetical protein
MPAKTPTTTPAVHAWASTLTEVGMVMAASCALVLGALGVAAGLARAHGPDDPAVALDAAALAVHAALEAGEDRPETLLPAALREDPWGRRWHVAFRQDGTVRITTLGADGVPGGEGADADRSAIVEPPRTCDPGAPAPHC